MADTKELVNTATGVVEEKKYKNVSDEVLDMVKTLQEEGGVVIPKDYSAPNALKSAWLNLLSVEDRNHKPALEVCTRKSIAKAMFDMVLQGLSVAKKQGYFIVYGTELQFNRSYFGTVALAKRTGGIKGEPVANVVYEDDEFEYLIDPKTAKTQLVKHVQKLGNIKKDKIVGAYCLVTLADGSTQVTIKSMDEIKDAWNQGPTKGNSPAHKNFPAEMCKKTVIGSACKMLINSSSDSWLYEDTHDGTFVDRAEMERQMALDNKKNVNLEEVDFEEVGTKKVPAQEKAPAQAEPAPAPAPLPDQAPEVENKVNDGPGY